MFTLCYVCCVLIATDKKTYLLTVSYSDNDDDDDDRLTGKTCLLAVSYADDDDDNDRLAGKLTY